MQDINFRLTLSDAEELRQYGESRNLLALSFSKWFNDTSLLWEELVNSLRNNKQKG